MYPDNNELLWVATEGKNGSKPSYTTKAYSTSGYYMLRSGWDKDATMMILKNNYNPTNQWHCQPDNGTFGLYRKDRNFFLMQVYLPTILELLVLNTLQLLIIIQ